jgi:hypothetical protein
MKYLVNIISFLSGLLLFACFYGCANNMVVKPNYQADAFKKKIVSEISNPKVISVIDNRHNDSTFVGIAQIGLFNKKVPYYLTEPVSSFVGSSMNKLIYDDKQNHQYVPVKIVIDSFYVHEKTFVFSEKGYFDCRLRFYYRLTNDSVNSYAVSSHQVSSEMDVTNSLEGLIYNGMKDCAGQFMDYYGKNLPKDSVKNELPDDLIIASTIKTNQISDSLKSKSSKKTTGTIGFQYLSGDIVNYGFQISYQAYSAFGNPQLEGGFGYTATYYDIINKRDYLKGSFFSFGGKYALRYFISPSPSGLYFSGGFRFNFGSEQIDYGYDNKKTNYFFGATFDEAIGVSISKIVFIEGGLFQIKQFGSDLLPYDVGYLIAFHFRI